MQALDILLYEKKMQQLVVRIASNDKIMKVTDICIEILDKDEYDKFPEILCRLDLGNLIQALKINTAITRICFGEVGRTLDFTDPLAAQLCSILESNHTISEIGLIKSSKLHSTPVETVVSRLLKLNDYDA